MCPEVEGKGMWAGAPNALAREVPAVNHFLTTVLCVQTKWTLLLSFCYI